jgi:hypothetical protein
MSEETRKSHWRHAPSGQIMELLHSLICQYQELGLREEDYPIIVLNPKQFIELVGDTYFDTSAGAPEYITCTVMGGLTVQAKREQVLRFWRTPGGWAGFRKPAAEIILTGMGGYGEVTYLR